MAVVASTKRGIGYGRLSQDRYGTSPNCQIQEAEQREYAQSCSYEFVDYRYDNDISASIFSNKPRPGYDDILKLVRANLADVLLATETSRIFRRVADVLEFLSIAQGTTLRWIETTDGHVYDLHTAHGVHSLIASINDADFEVRKNSERVKRTRREEAKAGKYHGGNRPYGYEGAVRGPCDVPDCRDKQNCKHGAILNRGRIGIVLVPHEAAIIRECVARLLSGWPIHSIVRDLNTRRITATNGGPWHPTQLKKVLRSKRLVGVRTHLGEEFPGKMERIISDEDFYRVQTILDSEERFKGAGMKGVRSYLLTGFIYCGLCGKLLLGSGGAYGKQGHSGRRYRCKKINAHVMEYGCGQISRLAEPVELLVSRAVLRRYSSPAFAEALAEASKPEDNGELSHLISEDKAAKQRLSEVEQLYASGQLDVEEMIRLKGMINEARAEVHRKLAKVETGRMMLSLPAGESLHAAWEKADLHTRRQLVGLLVERVELLPGRCGAARWEYNGKRYVFDPSKVRIKFRV